MQMNYEISNVGVEPRHLRSNVVTTTLFTYMMYNACRIAFYNVRPARTV